LSDLALLHSCVMMNELVWCTLSCIWSHHFSRSRRT